jgi:hypothetical protein
MKMVRQRFLAILGAWIVCCSLEVPVARAIIVFGSGDPARNTEPPSGSLEASGWRWQGRWKFALGTVIGPRQFVTARHLGGAPGDAFEFRGLHYRTVALTNRPGTDLNVVTVAGRFADFAPLNTGTHEFGRPLMLFGRGSRRGETVPGRGWWVGDYDGVLRWGTNTVKGSVAANQSPVGELLVFDFSGSVGSDEGMYTGGDSGSGAFVFDRDGLWRLAGVGYAVEGPYSSDTNAAPQFGALFDTRGLWAGPLGSQQRLPNGGAATGTLGYMTRVSSHAAWLTLQTSAQPPAGLPVLESSADLRGTFLEETAYSVDGDQRRIEVPLSTAVRFFRIRGAANLKLRSISNGVCTLQFDW